jgi:hypothetical protein
LPFLVIKPLLESLAVLLLRLEVKELLESLAGQQLGNRIKAGADLSKTVIKGVRRPYLTPLNWTRFL